MRAPAGCSDLEKVDQKNCNDPKYKPYSPDTLSFMFLITNTKSQTFDNVRIELGALPIGLRTNQLTNAIIPAKLEPKTSSVGVISISADPRLYDKTFNIPFVMLCNTNDTIAKDNICINVPGLLAKDSADNLSFGNVCPSSSEMQNAKVLFNRSAMQTNRFNIY